MYVNEVVAVGVPMYSKVNAVVVVLLATAADGPVLELSMFDTANGVPLQAPSL